MPERLQKILARHGLGSRREIERWIAEGRVTVNNKPAQIGAAYQDGDRIAIDGKEVTARLTIDVPPQVLIYHKPQAQPVGREEEREAAETALERLPSVRGARWIPINPMHPGDSGLLLVTNDGKLGYALTRRKRWIPTAYVVRVLAARADAPPAIPLDVVYDEERVEFSKVEPVTEPLAEPGANFWYRVELDRADRRAAVRALFESRGFKVSRMTQVAFGPIELPRDLPRGRHRALLSEQVAALYDLAQIKMPEAPIRHKTTDFARKKKNIAPDRRRKPKKHTGAHSKTSRADRSSRSPRRSR